MFVLVLIECTGSGMKGVGIECLCIVYRDLFVCQQDFVIFVRFVSNHFKVGLGLGLPLKNIMHLLGFVRVSTKNIISSLGVRGFRVYLVL